MQDENVNKFLLLPETDGFTWCNMILPDKIFLHCMTILSNFRRQNSGYCKGDYSVTWHDIENPFPFSFKGRIELNEYVYMY